MGVGLGRAPDVPTGVAAGLAKNTALHPVAGTAMDIASVPAVDAMAGSALGVGLGSASGAIQVASVATGKAFGEFHLQFA